MLHIKQNRYVYFTLKQLFLQGVHLGSQLTKSHTNMKRYLLPRSSEISFSILNLRYSLFYFRVGFNLIYNIISKRGVLLVVNESKVLVPTLQSYWSNLNQPVSFGEWSSGTLTNFRFILRKTLKTYFVKSRLAQKINKLAKTSGKLSLKLNNKIRAKFNLNIFLSELRRRIRKLYSLPHILFLTDTMLSSVVVNEANIVKIPLVGIVDSTNNILDVSYPIPGNSSSLKTLLFYYKLVKLVVLKGLLQEKINFLKSTSSHLNFEFKAHQLVKSFNSKSYPKFFTLSAVALDRYYFFKDFNMFLSNIGMFFLFYPNYDVSFYKKIPFMHTFIKWHLGVHQLNNFKLQNSFLKSYLSALLSRSRLSSKGTSLKVINLPSLFKTFVPNTVLNLNFSTFLKDSQKLKSIAKYLNLNLLYSHTSNLSYCPPFYFKHKSIYKQVLYSLCNHPLELSVISSQSMEEKFIKFSIPQSITFLQDIKLYNNSFLVEKAPFVLFYNLFPLSKKIVNIYKLSHVYTTYKNPFLSYLNIVKKIKTSAFKLPSYVFENYDSNTFSISQFCVKLLHTSNLLNLKPYILNSYLLKHFASNVGVSSGHLNKNLSALDFKLSFLHKYNIFYNIKLVDFTFAGGRPLYKAFKPFIVENLKQPANLNMSTFKYFFEKNYLKKNMFNCDRILFSGSTLKFVEKSSLKEFAHSNKIVSKNIKLKNRLPNIISNILYKNSGDDNAIPLNIKSFYEASKSNSFVEHDMLVNKSQYSVFFRLYGKVI